MCNLQCALLPALLYGHYSRQFLNIFPISTLSEDSIIMSYIVQTILTLRRHNSHLSEIKDNFPEHSMTHIMFGFI